MKEYFIFDPLKEFMPSRVVGWRLARKRYRDLKADDEGRWMSEELEVWLEPQGLLLRLRDPETGEVILLPEERADAAEERAEVLEAEVARLRRLLRGRQ